MTETNPSQPNFSKKRYGEKSGNFLERYSYSHSKFKGKRNRKRQQGISQVIMRLLWSFQHIEIPAFLMLWSTQNCAFMELLLKPAFMSKAGNNSLLREQKLKLVNHLSREVIKQIPGSVQWVVQVRCLLGRARISGGLPLCKGMGWCLEKRKSL